MALPTGAESKVIATVSPGPNPLPRTFILEVGGPACTERVMSALAAWTGTCRTWSRPKLRTPTSRREKTTITLKREEKDIERTSLSKMRQKREPIILAIDDRALFRCLPIKRCKNSQVNYLRSVENRGRGRTLRYGCDSQICVDDSPSHLKYLC